MPEESTTPDLAETARAGFEAVARGDFDGAVGFFTPDAVFEMVGLANVRANVAGHGVEQRIAAVSYLDAGKILRQLTTPQSQPVPAGDEV